MTLASDLNLQINQCTIDLSAVETNIATFRNILGETRLMAMVKAGGYGTDPIRLAQFLEGCDVGILGVSFVQEGIDLRRAGIEQAVFVLHASPNEAPDVVEWGLEVGVTDVDLVNTLAQEAENQGKVVKVHLNIDTGMGRLGCCPELALVMGQQIQSNNSLHLEGLMTHLACAGNPEDDAFTLSQIEQFSMVIDKLKERGIMAPLHHVANTSGVIRFALPQCNMARLGLGLFGIYPSDACRTLPLQSAISLTSRIIQINTRYLGDTISYRRNYTVKEGEQQIAVVPLGYYDGLHRHYSEKGEVMILGQRAPIVGDICMDFMMVDVSHIPNVAVGESVLIFGEGLSIEEFCSMGNSFSYELMTSIGPRIPRVFIH